MKKVSIGLFFEMSKEPYMDLSHPQDDNPGMGGTQYCFLLLSYFLSILQEKYIPVIYTSYQGDYPSGLK